MDTQQSLVLDECMHSPYSKPWKSLDQQLEILKARGLVIDNEVRARAWLARTNYYRLSGYWFPYRRRDPADPTQRRRLSVLYQGTKFETVEAVYEFDSSLRSHIFEGIERIEVALRASVGYHLGRSDPMAHRDPSKLDSKFARNGHASFLKDLDEDTQRSKEDFVRHIRDSLQQHLPVWAATELMTFGALKNLALGLTPQDRGAVAADLGLINLQGQAISSALPPVLECIRVIRNVCGHHGRLWNKTITKQMPDSIRQIESLQHLKSGSVPKHYTYEAFAVLAYLVKNVSGDTAWSIRLRQILEGLPAPHMPVEMGCPQGWENEKLWS